MVILFISITNYSHFMNKMKKNSLGLNQSAFFVWLIEFSIILPHKFASYFYKALGLQNWSYLSLVGPQGLGASLLSHPIPISVSCFIAN